jgi:DnaJ-class molecular chaperone
VAESICPRCGGAGEIELPTLHEAGPDGVKTWECPDCRGSGTLPSNTRAKQIASKMHQGRPARPWRRVDQQRTGLSAHGKPCYRLG